MDSFMRTLVLDIWLQVELHGPEDFHEATMYAEWADSTITHVSSQDTRNSWKKGYKGGPPQRTHIQVKSSGGEIGAHGAGSLEPMELGVV